MMTQSPGTQGADPFECLREKKGFKFEYFSHAKSILFSEFRESLSDLADALDKLVLPITEIIGSGGGETKLTQRLRRSLTDKGWRKHKFSIQKTIDRKVRESISHEVDHVRLLDVGALACEIEWNNKDPFFDRDLENFKRLHAEGAISVGILITRGQSLQDCLENAVLRFAKDRRIKDFADLKANGYVPTDKQREAVLSLAKGGSPASFQKAWAKSFVASKYGQATTHWKKLDERIKRGVGNPCPLLLIGLPDSLVVFDDAPIELLEEDDWYGCQTELF